jgi:single-stranded DNA-binding protein
MNTVTISGKVVDVGVLRKTGSGCPAFNAVIECVRRYQKGSEPTEEWHYIPCSFFGPIALRSSEPLVVGDSVIVTGRLSSPRHHEKISFFDARIFVNVADYIRLPTGKELSQPQEDFAEGVQS